MRRNWDEINKEIEKCRKQFKSPEEIISCLLGVFQRTNDGWVAFNLASEYEKINQLKDALKYYEEAERLLPLHNYKEQAREAIRRIKSKMTEGISPTESLSKLDEILKFNPAETLLIVSCSKEKIWENDPHAPDFVPAKYAYKGKKFLTFLNWAEKNQTERKGFFWVILSGKYGFIEPWHPISRYDINLNNPNDYPISDETLKNQVNQKRWWRDKDGILIDKDGIRMKDFKNIISINCSSRYIDAIIKCFPDAKHYSLYDIEL